MVIAINTLFYSKENVSGYYKQLFNALIPASPGHTFILIFSEQSVIDEFPNTILFNTGSAPQWVEKWNLWAYFKLKKVCKQYKPDILINNGETLFIPKQVSQIMLNPDLVFFQAPEKLPRRTRRFYQHFLPSSYNKIPLFLVVSGFEKDFLLKNYAVKESRVKVISPGINLNITLPEGEEKDKIKEEYAKGFEYFLYSGYVSTTKNLLNLLKGYSAFKKRQRSNMQLIITGEEGAKYEEFKKALELYKYKADVHLVPFLNIEQQHRILSGAYASVFAHKFDKSIGNLLISLKYEIPAIVPAKSTLSEAGGDGVLEYDTENVQDIAAKMMLIFKDEKLRTRLITNARSWIGDLDFDKSIVEIREKIESINHHHTKGQE